MDKTNAVRVLGLIAGDAEGDVREFEGKPFNGRAIADFNGKQNAMIQALANILKELVEELVEQKGGDDQQLS